MESLLKLILPELLFKYFQLEKHQKGKEELHFYFVEKNIIPENTALGKIHSKGFYKESTLEDFPIRGKKVYLHIKRRKWMDMETGKIIKRDWDLVSKGTRLTKEFADFLKEYH